MEIFEQRDSPMELPALAEQALAVRPTRRERLAKLVAHHQQPMAAALAMAAVIRQAAVLERAQVVAAVARLFQRHPVLVLREK